MAAKDEFAEEEVKKLFDLFDADQSGAIDRSELRVLCFALVRIASCRCGNAEKFLRITCHHDKLNAGPRSE
mgnify:CR=1 FL=1